MKLDVITAHRLRMLDLDPDSLAALDPFARAQRIYAAFIKHVPYENLSDNRVVRESPDDPDNWPRATDRLLRENVAYGLGGTSFSLAYALRDLLRGAGANAHCTLGYNLVTEQGHAAVVVYVDEGPFLYDPSMLMAGPVPVRPGGKLEDPLGEICLEPRCGPTLTLTLKMRCGAHRPVTADPLWGAPVGADGHRPIYSVIPVPAPPQGFRQAWMASFYRGRPMPLRLARRVEDVIYRYGERPGSIEVLRADRREEITPGRECAEVLNEVFGIDVECLELWFKGRRDC
jgi:hypothetical protein